MYRPYYRGGPGPYYPQGRYGMYPGGWLRWGWPVHRVGGRILAFLIALVLAYLLLPLLVAFLSLIVLLLLAYVLYRGIIFLTAPFFWGAGYRRGPGRIL